MRTPNYDLQIKLLSAIDDNWEVENLRRERAYLVVEREKADAKIRDLDQRIADMGQAGEDAFLKAAGWLFDDTVKGDHVWEHEFLCESPVTREWALKTTRAAVMFSSMEAKPSNPKVGAKDAPVLPEEEEVEA